MIDKAYADRVFTRLTWEDRRERTSNDYDPPEVLLDQDRRYGLQKHHEMIMDSLPEDIRNMEEWEVTERRLQLAKEL